MWQHDIGGCKSKLLHRFLIEFNLNFNILILNHILVENLKFTSLRLFDMISNNDWEILSRMAHINSQSDKHSFTLCAWLATINVGLFNHYHQ